MFLSLKNRWFVALAAAAWFAVMVGAYSFLPLTVPGSSASPDEAANLYFSKSFAERGELWLLEPLDFFAPGMIHPRSTRIAESFVVPGGFLGLPVLYGLFGKLTGVAAIPFFTPVLAALAVAAWGALCARLFGRRIGVAAALLLATHPIWWYETARTMQPNVLFVALVIAAAWLFVCAPLHSAYGTRTGFRVTHYADAVLAGIAFGFALTTRPSEAYWLALGGAILLACFWRTLPWRRLLVAAVATILACAPFVLLGIAAYGAPFSTGYGAAGEAVAADLPHGRGAELLGPLQPYLFPLGFAPRDAVRHFMDFGLGITGWWTVLVACGLVALALEWRKNRVAGRALEAPVRAMIWVAAVSSAWLILFYGSWTIHDNPDPNAVTIGSSYLRYWLPIYVFSTLPVAWLAARAADILGGLRGRAFLAFFLMLAALSGATDVFYAPQEGLLATRAGIRSDREKAAAVIGATPDNSVIVVDRADKYLFPERRVMVPLRSESTYAALGALKRRVSLYYFGITFPEQDLEWLRSVKLPPLGLGIEPVLTVREETLYRFTMLKQASVTERPAETVPATDL